MDGKAMIVCMSRRICVDLFNALIKLRPEWDTETLKVVMTGSAVGGPEWQRHIGNKTQRCKLAVDGSLNAMGSPYKALVAFTDVVKDAKDGQEYTGAKMNGFPEAATGDVEKSMKYEG